MSNQPITGYFCSCIVGARTSGCCSHVAASLYHLFVKQDQVKAHQTLSTSFFNYIECAEKYEEWEHDDDASILFSPA